MDSERQKLLDGVVYCKCWTDFGVLYFCSYEIHQEMYFTRTDVSHTRVSARSAWPHVSFDIIHLISYRNWPRYGLRWSGLCCHFRHSTSGAGRRAAGPTSAVPGVAAQTTTAQTVWVVNFYSTTKTKQYTTINRATIMTMSRHAETPWLATPLWWWKRP